MRSSDLMSQNIKKLSNPSSHSVHLGPAVGQSRSASNGTYEASMRAETLKFERAETLRFERAETLRFERAETLKFERILSSSPIKCLAASAILLNFK